MPTPDLEDWFAKHPDTPLLREYTGVVFELIDIKFIKHRLHQMFTKFDMGLLEVEISLRSSEQDLSQCIREQNAKRRKAKENGELPVIETSSFTRSQKAYVESGAMGSSTQEIKAVDLKSFVDCDVSGSYPDLIHDFRLNNH